MSDPEPGFEPVEPPECPAYATVYDEEGVEIRCDKFAGHPGEHFDPIFGWWIG